MRVAKGVEVVVRSAFMRSVPVATNHRQELLLRGSEAFAVGVAAAHSISNRTVAFASARLDRRHPHELVNTDFVGQFPAIDVSMSNPFLWPRSASRAPSALVINERNVITLSTCGAIEINVMTLPSILPRLCTDSNCREQHTPAERVALAMSLCDARGAQLTTLRRQVLELLWESGRPMGRLRVDRSTEAQELPSGRASPPSIGRLSS